VIDRGMAQLVAHSLWERGVASSSLAAPTIFHIEESVMKRFYMRVLIYALLISNTIQSSEIVLSDIIYTKEAVTWVRDYILDEYRNLRIYPKELQLIANLIYFSYKRSYSNLFAQEIAIENLERAWQGWQNIAQTRLDPSKSHPYKVDSETTKAISNQMWNLHDHHIKMGATYSKTESMIVRGNILISDHAKRAVQDMRSQARKVVAKSLVDIRKYFGDIFYEKKNMPEKGLKFIDYIYSYIPQLAVNSFVEANHTNDIISEEGWLLFLKIQNIGKRTWQIIEQERASFYLAFYKEIMKVFALAQVDNGYKAIMFNEFGQIPIEYQNQFLSEQYIYS